MVTALPDEERRLLDDTQQSDTTREGNEHDTYDTFHPDSTGKLNGNADEPTYESAGYTWTTVFMIMSTWIGVFFASVDMSVMATLTDAIAESFSSFQLLTWFINAYTVSSALVQPLSGKLSDIYGRRDCLLWANFAFLVGNILCGLATESWHFILGRAVAGLGGGCIHSISTFIASDHIPLRSRGFWQGLSNITYAIGFSTGGTLGGLISDSIGWKWVFLIQGCPIILSMAIVFWLVPNTTISRDTKLPAYKQIDLPGTILLTLAILTLMFGAVSGGNTLPWSSPLVYVPLILSPLFLGAFIYVEDKIAKYPVIPIRLLANRSILSANLTCFLASTANTGAIYYIPLLMEVRGLTPAQAGLRLVPNAIGAFVGSLGVGVLMNKTGRYYWLLIGSLMLITATSITYLITLQQITGWLPFVLFAFNGLAFGGIVVTTLIALVSAAEHKHHAVVTACSYAFRLSGHTLGPTIAGAIFQNVLHQQLWGRLGSKKHAGILIPAILRRDINFSELPRIWREQIFASYDISFHSVFIFCVSTWIFAIIIASMVREHQLHSTLDRK